MENARTYTREEANNLLPEVTERLVQLRDAYIRIAGHRATISSRATSNGGDSDPAGTLKASRSAAAELSWFAEAGIVLRDIEEGLLDFPGRRDGHDIFLCWRLGEEAVDFWHGPDTGFAGRKPL